MNTVDCFVRRDVRVEPTFNVGTALGKTDPSGQIGIEIEVEGKRLPKMHPILPQPWGYHPDGSLRGEDNAEYVLSKPVKFDDVPTVIGKLWGAFEASKSVLDDSNRTSVHVHLNCTSFHFNRLTSFAALYFCFEEIMTEWCGEHRVGNLFCLRAKDAPAIVSQLRRFIKQDGRFELRDNLHYAGLNCHALTKFGSVEIRTLRGTSDPQVILDWVTIIRRLYEVSAEYKDPRDIPAEFSRDGPLGFFDRMLGEAGVILRRDVPWDDSRLVESMYEGIRLAQDLCYCRDWTLFKTMDLRADPFGRDPRKVAKAMLMAGQGPNAPATSSWMAADAATQQANIQATIEAFHAHAQPTAVPLNWTTLVPHTEPAMTPAEIAEFDAMFGNEDQPQPTTMVAPPEHEPEDEDDDFEPDFDEGE